MDSRRHFLRLLIELRLIGGFPVPHLFLRALFDNGDFFARQAVKRIDKPVDLGFQGGNIGALSASVVRLSRLRRRCNEAMLTFSGFRKRGSDLALAHFEILRILKR